MNAPPSPGPESTRTPAGVRSRIDDLLHRVPTGLFLDGEWVQCSTRFDVENPATGAVLARVSDAASSDALRALDAAASAQASWAATDPRERSEMLRRAWQLLQERADDFVLCMTLEMGKPLADSRSELAYGSEFLRWFAEEAVRIEGRYGMAPSGGLRIATLKQPVGPAYAITPWNFPLAMATRKIGPALAAGCTVILKPAAETPLTSLLLAQVLADAGVPRGVVAVLPTSDAPSITAPLLSDPRLRKLTFTGSTPVGRRLLAQSADRVLRTSMELGGNAPFLVLPSADLDAALDGAMVAKMRTMGEACTAANRFLVPSQLADEFAGRLAERMDALVVGDGVDDGTQVGPMISSRAVDRLQGLVDDATSRGARVLCGGRRLERPGHFMAPTVLAGVDRDARVATEEIFGPVAPVLAYDGLDEAVALANATEFGLVGYVYATDLSEAIGVAERLETGMVGINTGLVSNPAAPFGGVKESGLGREGSHEGLEEYLETKYLAMSI